MANIRVTCPACKSELEIDAAFEGQEVECGNCLEVFKAKAPGEGGSSRGGGKIPGTGALPASGGGCSKPADRPAKKKRRDDDDDYDHDRRRRDDEDDDEDYAPPPPRGSRGSPGDGVAVAALVLGIVGVMSCCCWPLSIPAGIGACVTGGLGLKSQNNKGLAVAGLVLGVVALCLGGFFLLGGIGNAFVNPNWFR